VLFFLFQADSISGFHSNTHIPVVVGAQMRYEVTGDPLYKVNILASHVCLRVEMLYFIHVEAPIMGCVLKYMTY
jgi:hypothetical protein